MGGLGAVSAIAQAPSFSTLPAPPIPPGPGSPSALGVSPPSAPPIVSPPQLDIDVLKAPSNPALSDLSQAPGMESTAKPANGTVAPATGDALSDLPKPVEVAKPAPPPNPESGDMAGVQPVGSSPSGMITSGPPPLPGVTLPGNNPNSPPPLTLAPPPVAGLPPIATATTLPEVDLGEELPQAKPKVKTWNTTLAPSIIPPKTNFNYKRVVLPDSIYRDSYDRGNAHLPTRLTREEYQHLLFLRVAANDVNAARALLNTGISPNATDPAGETLLSVARRYGAPDTARLLMARGAQG